ncbi:MAG: imidazole glycerol phosphate synthase subunit HisH [Nitrospirae bacterium]|nr:MAG: imidazole glycerol phosphate synthase subunit HisH [Nitrospirota bacterium]
MIAIIDYDMGNLKSVHKAFESVGHCATVTRDPKVIADASHVVLPGVGAFGDCMRNLERHGLVEPVLGALRAGKPFLGICLGFQLLFSESEEFGTHRGLGVIPGRVIRFSSGGSATPMKVPHMGWNSIAIRKRSPMLDGVPDGAFMYFVHSYYVVPDEQSVACTMTDYGWPFVSSVARDNIFACQFHPEKSQGGGLRIIRNFGGLS